MQQTWRATDARVPDKREISVLRACLLAVLLWLPAKALACSCMGTASIEETIADYPVLVEARVVGFNETNTAQYGRQVRSVTLQVTRVFKGEVASSTITIEHSMCYVSLYPELMQVGHFYVLPLSASSNGAHYMVTCAHSALELADGRLYTFEHTEGLGRRLQFYKEYPQFIRELASFTRRMTPIAGNTGYCKQEAPTAFCQEWALVTTPSLRVVAAGYEDGMNYDFYRLKKDGSYQHIVQFYPVIRDDVDGGALYWGYPWDIRDIALPPRAEPDAVLATFAHQMMDDGEVQTPDWQKRIPAVLFTGRPSVTRIPVAPTNITSVTVDELRAAAKH